MERMDQIEFLLLRVLDTEVFLFPERKAGGDFIEKPERVRPLFWSLSQVAAFWGAVLGRSLCNGSWDCSCGCG